MSAYILPSLNLTCSITQCMLVKIDQRDEYQLADIQLFLINFSNSGVHETSWNC